VSAGKSWLVSAKEAIKLFAHKQRIRLSSAQADIEIQALKKSLNLLSRLDISMTADRITLSAKEEVVINGGGSYTIWNASGITSGTTGTHNPAYGSRPDASQSLELYRAVLGSAAEEVAS